VSFDPKQLCSCDGGSINWSSVWIERKSEMDILVKIKFQQLFHEISEMLFFFFAYNNDF